MSQYYEEALDRLTQQVADARQERDAAIARAERAEELTQDQLRVIRALKEQREKAEEERNEAQEALVFVTEQAAKNSENNERLRAAIGEAPHDDNCATFTSGPLEDSGGAYWGYPYPCDCWKRRTLEGES